MALSASKYNLTVQAMARGGASGTGLLLNADTLKLALFTTAPAATDTTYAATATEVSNGNGYTTGGVSLTGATSNSAGTETLKTTADFSATTWTASSAGFSFRYLVFYDSTASSAVCQNLARWDYGSTVTLSGSNGDIVDLSSSNFDTTGWGSLV